METTKNKLPEKEQQFFNELSKYLDTSLYYYGSVQRNDYFPGKSDIDVDIFTDNEHALIARMQHFLHVERRAFKKFVWRLNHNNKMIYGYKIMYKNSEQNFSTEISIYNEKIKNDILKEHINKISLPFYISWLLVSLKILYYNLNIIDKHTFRYLKKKLLTIGIGLPDDDFVVIDSK
jgi:hypothetical protein